MVYRLVQLGNRTVRRRGETGELQPKQGYWYGPGTILTTESSQGEDTLRPRIYYVSLFGRLYRCAEHQLRAMSPQAELARRRLIEFQKNGGLVLGPNGAEGLRPDHQVPGIDITREGSKG